LKGNLPTAFKQTNKFHFVNKWSRQKSK
jgi:hypothetical protein